MLLLTERTERHSESKLFDNSKLPTKQRKILVEQYYTTNNIPLDIRQVPGNYKKISKDLRITEAQLTNALIKIRKERKIKIGFSPALSTVNVMKYLDDHNMDVFNMKFGDVPMIAEALNMNKKTVASTINRIKKKQQESNQKPKEGETISEEIPKQPHINIFTDFCVKWGLTRNNPNKEVVACENICKGLLDLPRGGKGIIIGTPTAFCASENKNNNLLLTDNLKVAHILDATTDLGISPTIVIGNAVNPEKAELKAFHWKNNNSTASYDVIIDVVDRDSFTYYVTLYAEKFDFCKVVLMTSGGWIGCESSKKKWGVDGNFKSPSEFLVQKFPGLHIIAMISGSGGESSGHYNYIVKHLHRGGSRIIK